ncbi:MAG: lactate utilization protein [Clostridia bacterium]|nr:lactate utilization protein [Clostridia bacterium]
MDKNKYDIIRLKMERTAEALRDNNMYCECVDSTEEALEIIESFLDEGDTVAVGGSMTLDDMGVLDMLRDGRYNFLDRYEEGADVQKIFRDSFSADVYLTSSNAITENGELYNVDGNGNRVAALIFGPKSVIVVAGYNKIVKDIEAAKVRVQEIAAPANATRLGCQTPCTKTGHCMNCASPQRICATAVITGRQRVQNRIKVILIGEELGY